MKLFIAGQGVTKKDMFQFRKEQREAGREISFLHSYLEIKNRDYSLLTKYLKPENAFLDSGAFTAFTQGTTIDIDDYIAVIKDLKIPNYAALDVIGDHEATEENLKYMLAKGTNPIPTFHYGSPKESLLKILKTNEYIALGGLVPHAMHRERLKAWLDYCFSIITSQKPLHKVHLFGVNSLWAWKRYPIYSADATSWVSGSKFRRIVEFKDGSMITHHKNSDTSMTHKVYNYDYATLNLHNIIEYQKAADWATKLWESRGIKWDN